MARLQLNQPKCTCPAVSHGCWLLQVRNLCLPQKPSVRSLKVPWHKLHRRPPEVASWMQPLGSQPAGHVCDCSRPRVWCEPVCAKTLYLLEA